MKTPKKDKATEAPVTKRSDKIISQEKKKTDVDAKAIHKENNATETPSTSEPKEITKETKRPEVKIVKKDEAITKGLDLHASMKQCKYICNFIKNKPIDNAIADLESVIKLKKVIPFSGEIPHRKGNIMSGRYPVNASKLFIPILKTLKGNVIANKMDLDKARITFASSSFASRPSKRGGGRFKRANVILKAKELGNMQNKEEKK